jgi:hypothetical protein
VLPFLGVAAVALVKTSAMVIPQRGRT